MSVYYDTVSVFEPSDGSYPPDIDGDTRNVLICLVDSKGNIMASERYVHGKATTFQIPLTGMVCGYRVTSLFDPTEVYYEDAFETPWFAAQFTEAKLELVIDSGQLAI